MAFPLLPLLLVAAAGGVVYVVAQKHNKALTEPVVKHGVEYGPQCSSVKVVDMQAFNQHLAGLEAQLDALGSKLKPATKARDALAAVMQLQGSLSRRRRRASPAGRSSRVPMISIPSRRPMMTPAKSETTPHLIPEDP